MTLRMFIQKPREAWSISFHHSPQKTLAVPTTLVFSPLGLYNNKLLLIKPLDMWQSILGALASKSISQNHNEDTLVLSIDAVINLSQLVQDVQASHQNLHPQNICRSRNTNKVAPPKFNTVVTCIEGSRAREALSPFPPNISCKRIYIILQITSGMYKTPGIFPDTD